MSEFIVHSIPGSPFNRAVLAALEEKRPRFKFAPLAFGTLRQQPHISRHPFGRIPLLEHGDFVLYETQAILRYLDRVVPAPALTPTDPKAAARMDQLMNICDWYLFQGVGNVIAFQRIIKPMIQGEAADETAIAAALPAAHTVFNEISRLLGDKAYLAAETLTLADLMVAPQLDFLAVTPEWKALTSKNANLTAWLSRVTARPSFRSTTWDAVNELAKAA